MFGYHFTGAGRRPAANDRADYPYTVAFRPSLECRKAAEWALTSVAATCYLLGVSMPRVDKLVQSLGSRC